MICVNDGSTDNSFAILEAYAKKEPRLMVINQQNEGVSSARNTGLDQSSGDYVAFVDSDDWVHPQYFELLADLAAEYKADCVFCGTRSVGQQEEAFEPYYSKKNIRVFIADLEGVMADHFWRTRIWGRLYNKQLLRDLRFPIGIRLAEDTVFNLSALCFKERLKVAATETKLYFLLSTSRIGGAHDDRGSLLSRYTAL